MSGEVIVRTARPAIALSAHGAVGAAQLGSAGVRVGSGVARGVKRRIEERVERAQAAAEAERRRAEAWRHDQADRHADMQATHQRLSDLWDQYRRASSSSAEKAPVVQQPRNDEVSGYLESAPKGTSRESLQNDVREVQTMLDELAETYPNSADAPFDRLRHLAQSYSNRLQRRETVSRETLDMFRQTVHRSVEDYLAAQANRKASTPPLVERARAMLDRLGLYQHMTAKHADRARELEHALKTRVAEPTGLSSPELDDIEARINTLREDVEAALYLEALRPELAAAVTENLEDMGYGCRTRFPDPTPDTGPADAAMDIPGGAQIAIRLDENGRLAFELRDDNGARVDQPANAEHAAYLRAQEKRWCSDLETLMGRLASQGFACSIQHERQVHMNEIPVAGLETADEWRAEPQKAKKQSRRPQHSNHHLRK